MTLEELEDDWQGEDFCIRVLCEDEQVRIPMSLTIMSTLSLIYHCSIVILMLLVNRDPHIHITIHLFVILFHFDD